MLETNKCPKCKHVYEITWDDDTSEYYNTSTEEDDDYAESELDDDLYPEFCPFCGIHRDYSSESDSYVDGLE